MRKQKRVFLVLVSQDAKSSFRQFSLPRAWLKIGLAVFVAGLAAAIGLTLHYARLLGLGSLNSSLERENSRLLRENQSYKLQVKELGERISALEMTSKKLALISGLEPLRAGFGGMGGATREPPVRAGEEAANYRQRLARLEESLRSLNEFYFNEFVAHTYIPSIWPVKGYPSGSFGGRQHPVTGGQDYHAGIDIAAPYGNKVVATAAGTVIYAGPHRGYGNLVVVVHKFGFSTRYAHLSRVLVEAGQRVERNQVIGLVGDTGLATGPHLHYEIRVNDRPQNPYRFLKTLNAPAFN